jgi:hypothetical protein
MVRLTVIAAFLVVLTPALAAGVPGRAALAQDAHASGPMRLAAAPLMATPAAEDASNAPVVATAGTLDAGPLLIAAAPSAAGTAISATALPTAAAASDPPVACPPGAVGEQQPFIALYGWVPAISATAGVDDFESSVHASISDVLHHFKGGGAAHYESGGRTNVVLDVIYAKLGGTNNTPDTSIDWTVKQWLVEAGVTLGRTGTDRQFGEGLVGGRYFSLSTDLSLSPQAVSASDTKAWAEPLVGGRYGVVLSPKWFLLVAGDVGGFGVGSHLTWEGVASFRYHLSQTVDLGLGYRYMHIDYDKSNFKFVGSMSGPLIGIGWLL